MEALTEEYRNRIIQEANDLAENPEETNHLQTPREVTSARDLPVKLTSFEGAKGLSAYHVFVVGLHENEFPRDRANIQDIEICRFVVGLTRTRKQCTLMVTDRFANEQKRPSVFLTWIQREKYSRINVDAGYWRGQGR